MKKIKTQKKNLQEHAVKLFQIFLEALLYIKVNKF